MNLPVQPSASLRLWSSDCRSDRRLFRIVSQFEIERANLTMRMANRRFTRLTNAFSKKFETHVHMIAIYTVWYNLIRIHKTLKMSLAMAAGVSQTL
ncbi:hypothetical protein D3227_06425 [Mesorhizobium waimense]|uniref:IS1 family transposase n=1 Tax=Mesorhizobium waimense TaxID=1300307 RepID=A0A3A5LAV4_9HYPH|nr:hypothetical protein D3227_06425 [Mesorhizobium waimense]